MSEKLVDPNNVISAYSLLDRIWGKRYWILLVSFFVAVLFYAFSFTMEVNYRSSTKLIPSTMVSDGGQSPAFGRLMSFAGDVGLSLQSSGDDPSVLIPEILKSYDFTSALLNTAIPIAGKKEVPLLDLINPDGNTEEERLNKAHKSLTKDILSSSFDSKSGVTRVSVVWPDPDIAADLANIVAFEIDRYHLEMRTSQARLESIFITRRLQEVEEELEGAEQALVTFRENNRAISGTPQLMLIAERLEREVEVQHSLFVTLKSQQEIVKIQELKSVPTLRVLEKARPIRERYSPRRATFALSGFFLSFALSVFWALMPNRT